MVALLLLLVASFSFGLLLNPREEARSKDDQSKDKLDSASDAINGPYLDIPKRNGEIITLSRPVRLQGHYNFGFREYDRGQACDMSKEYGEETAVFILENGASLSNAIIGVNQINAIVCLGACSLYNVYFRGVCDDAVEIHGVGNVLIQDCGAQNAPNKVVQHNSLGGTVTIRGGKYVNVAQVYRSCGTCPHQQPRHLVMDGVQLYDIKVDVAGINSNYGDTAYITNCCGSVNLVCQTTIGKDETGQVKTALIKLKSKQGCQGSQGQLNRLPSCVASTAMANDPVL